MLIGKDPQKTNHEKIQKTLDPFIPYHQLKIDLDDLYSLLENNNVKNVKIMLAKLVTSFVSNSKIVDYIYTNKIRMMEINFLPKSEEKILKIKI